MAREKLNLADYWDHADPRDVPIYGIPEAAHYLCIPKATVRAWVLGTSYTQAGTRRQFSRVIDLPKPKLKMLSFFNLAECHVLRALRTIHGIQLPAIRRALKYVSQEMGWARPLIQQQFKTDGAALFVERLGKLVEASAGGQLVFDQFMKHLDRIEWDQSRAARLYPFTCSSPVDAPMSVLIDPRRAFGRPILRDTGITTSIIAQRYKAGETIESLADDYRCTQIEIQEAIRCELRLDIAA